MNIPKILITIRPGASWSLRGDTYEDLEWHDEVQVKPTLQEMEDAQADLDDLSYRDQRAVAYPPLGDGLDALVHKENGDVTIWEAYVDACNAVKAQFPKPE